jgi:hypothetical protein
MEDVGSMMPVDHTLTVFDDGSNDGEEPMSNTLYYGDNPRRAPQPQALH